MQSPTTGAAKLRLFDMSFVIAILASVIAAIMGGGSRWWCATSLAADSSSSSSSGTVVTGNDSAHCLLFGAVKTVDAMKTAPCVAHDIVERQGYRISLVSKN